ncbi:MAG: hypothetical protein K2K59_05555, partial [Muribaculaceae bacterium]|nr:hypothetical protein [Muribaculaceae bacterium]
MTLFYGKADSNPPPPQRKPNRFAGAFAGRLTGRRIGIRLSIGFEGSSTFGYTASPMGFILYFLFCTLHFAFCILYFVFIFVSLHDKMPY